MANELLFILPIDAALIIVYNSLKSPPAQFAFLSLRKNLYNGNFRSPMSLRNQPPFCQPYSQELFYSHM